MEILHLHIASFQTSHNQLKFYQEQNKNNIIALQETNVKDKNWKRRFHSTFTEKKIGRAFHVKVYQKLIIQNSILNNIFHFTMSI